MVVRGQPNPLQAAGRDGGLKLMDIKRLREKGHKITLLNETQFWRLVSKVAIRYELFAPLSLRSRDPVILGWQVRW